MPAYNINGKKVLFIHIPKTGGSSIEKYLRKFSTEESLYSSKRKRRESCYPQHLDYKSLTQKIDLKEADFVFTVVREPVARFLSECRHRVGRRSLLKSYRVSEEGFFLAARFLHRCNPFALGNHVRPQSDFIGKDVRVFKFEDGIPVILNQLAEELGLPAPGSEIYHEKRSASSETKPSQGLCEAVLHFYEKDGELFNYQIIPGEGLQENKNSRFRLRAFLDAMVFIVTNNMFEFSRRLRR